MRSAGTRNRFGSSAMSCKRPEVARPPCGELWDCCQASWSLAPSAPSPPQQPKAGSAPYLETGLQSTTRTLPATLVPRCPLRCCPQTSGRPVPCICRTKLRSATPARLDAMQV